MSYHFVVTGIGICVGNITNHEDFIEDMIAEKPTKRKRPKDALKYAIKEALKNTDDGQVLLLSEESISEEVLAEFGISEQKVCFSFANMLDKAGNIFQKNLWKNVLLVSKNKEGCIAVLLSESAERHFVQVEMEQESTSQKEEQERNKESENSGVGKKVASIVQVFTGKKKKSVEETNLSVTPIVPKMPAMDAMMEFVKAIIEVRFAMRFDGSGENEIYLWDWEEKRKLTRTIDGIKFKVKEAELVNKVVFESKRYIIPLMFDTVEEAKENLLHLQKTAQEKGLFFAMQMHVEALKAKRKENTIVFLVEDVNSLKTQIQELLAKSYRLLEDGFYWKSKTGSLYIRHNTKNPKIVFMNPPGGMFNSKAFHRFVGKLYEFVDENSKYSDENRMGTSENKLLNNYLSEVITTYVVMFLLENIGIKPNYLSGASMGEIVFHYLNLELKNQSNVESKVLHDALRPVEIIMRRILEQTDLQEKRYFDHKINLAKYYLKFRAEKVKKAIKDYDDVFLIIEGSPKDVIVCGEKKSCEKLFRQIGCIAKLLDEPTYVHTPVIEYEYENIQRELVAHELYLNLKNRDYKIMSSYFKQYMDETCEMFAENFAAIITKSVDYTQTVEKLYEEGARVFIDISTTQLCGNWAKVTLEGKPDAQVVSVYEDRDTAEYLTNLCVAMLAGNVTFDFEKMYSKIKFVKDSFMEEIDIALLKEDIQNVYEKAFRDGEVQTEEMAERKVSTEVVAEETAELEKVASSGVIKEVEESNVSSVSAEKTEESNVSSVSVEKTKEVRSISENPKRDDRKTIKNSEKVHKKDVKNIPENSNDKPLPVLLEKDIQEQFHTYLKNQMSVNQKAYEMYVQAENQLFAQALASFGNSVSNEITNKVTDVEQTVETTKAEVAKKIIDVNPPTVKEKTMDKNHVAVPKKATVPSTTTSSNKNYLWDRAQIIEMTENSMAAVLGEQYKEVDKYAVRARMPLPPFLFASRIISIDAEFGKLRPSSIVAEYDIEEDCVFRRGDTMITSLISSEASHIGIFLMGYMGLDVMSNGTLSYRALDSEETYYSNRQFRVGDVMRTVFKVHKFVQNGSTTIISYTFETYNGEELISACEAVGGFFTKAELASNKGIVTPKRLLQKVEQKELLHFVNNKRTSYTEEEVLAFFNGNYEACFGNEVIISLKEKYYIPSDMKMIQRVTNIDYNGGKYGCGLICGERDITPDMWPFEAHFKNDPVFPGIIMIDGAIQLAVFLMAHTGILGHYHNTCIVTKLNSTVKSKFRGQVRKAHSILRYEMHIREAEEREDGIHFVMDAGIFNNEVQVIQVEHFTFRIFGDPK